MLKLCALQDLEENSAKGFQLEGQNIFSVLKDGDVYVYRNLCPHLSVSLEWEPDQFLDDEKAFIQCSTHGALFRVENGQCIQGPCLGEKLESVDFTIDNHCVWIDL